MYDTTIMLKPRDQWRPGMTYEKLIQDMDEKLQFPGLTNTWTMPVQNRLDMELTGIKTAVGIKIQGPDLAHIQEIGAQMQQVLSAMPETSSVFAERVSQGFYLNVEVNRPDAARYGLTVADVQRVITSEIGGADIAQNVEGRERFPIAVRYQRDFRDDPEAIVAGPHPHALRRADSHRRSGARLVFARSGDDSRRRRRTHRLRLSQLQDQRLRRLRGSALSVCSTRSSCCPPATPGAGPASTNSRCAPSSASKIILPIVFFVIFLLLYLVFKSATEAAVLIFPTLYAMSGGLLLQWMLGYNFSVAVWVGYIALFGIAVETGVVMVVYLDEAFQQSTRNRNAIDRSRPGARPPSTERSSACGPSS